MYPNTPTESDKCNIFATGTITQKCQKAPATNPTNVPAKTCSTEWYPKYTLLTVTAAAMGTFEYTKTLANGFNIVTVVLVCAACRRRRFRTATAHANHASCACEDGMPEVLQKSTAAQVGGRGSFIMCFRVCAKISFARMPSNVPMSHSSLRAKNAPKVATMMQKGIKDASANNSPSKSSSGYRTYVKLKGFIGELLIVTSPILVHHRWYASPDDTAPRE